VEPRDALRQAGATVHLVTPGGKPIRAWRHHEPGQLLQADRALEDVTSPEFDALLLPGGVANPDALRTDEHAVQLVREFMASDRPVAAICHAPWLLVEAGAVAGRTLTSWPSLATDLRNAGATWVDADVQVDGQLVTSRKPDDIPHFVRELTRVIAAASEQRRVDSVVEQSFPASDPAPGPTSIGGVDRQVGA
jgi:protease I